MKILVVNAGSSSLKYQLIDMDGEKELAKGLVERIGIEGSKLKHSAGDPDSLISDNRAIMAEFPWQPRYADLEQIVTHALAWERKLSAQI